MVDHNYFVYISTNPKKTVLYTGVTNDLHTRIIQHKEDNQNNRLTFAGKYFCYNLIYFERFQNINHAIEREKEIKGWTRLKKVKLINEINPTWKFLNDEV